LLQKKSKNLEARAVVSALRKTVESLNKSTYLRSRFEEIQMAKNGGKPGRKISNPPMHRWGATEATIEGVLSNWDELARAHRDSDKSSAWESMEEIKVVLMEFHSILRPFRQVQVLAQSGSKFNLPTALMKLSSANRKISIWNKSTLRLGSSSFCGTSFAFRTIVRPSIR
jgi:hypothetical protein